MVLLPVLVRILINVDTRLDVTGVLELQRNRAPSSMGLGSSLALGLHNWSLLVCDLHLTHDTVFLGAICRLFLKIFGSKPLSN